MQRTTRWFRSAFACVALAAAGAVAAWAASPVGPAWTAEVNEKIDAFDAELELRDAGGMREARHRRVGEAIDVGEAGRRARLAAVGP